VINLSSSDTEEALELLSLSPARGPHSPLSNIHSSSDSALFEEWPEATNMVASVNVALTAYASSSLASTVNAMRVAESVLDTLVHGRLHQGNLCGRKLC
jgi:hypothetical protein